MTFPFGKYAGQPLTRIPEGYLRWALTADRTTPELARAIRIHPGELPLEAAAPAPDLTMLERKRAAAEDPAVRRIFGQASDFVRSIGKEPE